MNNTTIFERSNLKDLNFHFVSNMLQVLDIALLEEKVSGAMDMTVKENKASAKLDIL